MFFNVMKDSIDFSDKNRGYTFRRPLMKLCVLFMNMRMMMLRS